MKKSSLDAYISLGVLEPFGSGMEKPLKKAYRVLKDQGLIF